MNKKCDTSKPQTESAAASALGPGMGITLIPSEFVYIKSTSSLPGSEIPGVPASLINATSSPESKSFKISSFFSCGECW